MSGRPARYKLKTKEQPNKPRKYSSKFNTEWKLKKEYSSWLTGVEGDDSRAYCSLCSRSFDVSNMGLSAIYDHHNGMKHFRRFKALNNKDQSITSFFGQRPATPSSSSNPEEIASNANNFNSVIIDIIKYLSLDFLLNTICLSLLFTTNLNSYD